MFDLERFERDVVLRVSRWVYLLIAGATAVTLVVSGVVLAYALTPTLRGSEPVQAAEVRPEPVTSEELLAMVTVEEAPVMARAAVERPPTPPGAPPHASPTPDPAIARVSALKAAVAARFDTEVYPWLDEVRSTCVWKNWMGQCAEWERRVSQRGARTVMSEALEGRAWSVQVDVLEAMLALMDAAPDSDDDRFVHLGVVKDLTGAWSTAPVAAVARLVAFYRGSPGDASKGEPAVAPLDDEARRLVAGTLLRMTKSAGTSSDFVAWLDLFASRMRDLPTEDQAAYLQSSWNLALLLGSEGREAGADVLAAAMAEAPRPARLQLVDAYARRHESALAAAQAENARARLAWEQEVAERDAAYLATVTTKQGARMTALSGLLGALASLAVLGLFLAVLAVERNTRAVRKLAMPSTGADGA